MNTVTITVGRFTPLNLNDKPTILIVARDQYAETTFSFESAQDAVDYFPTELSLVEGVMSQPGFDDLRFADTDDDKEDLGDSAINLEGACLFIEGYQELRSELNQ